VTPSAFLLDTHAFLWWKTNDGRLTAVARQAIEEEANSVFLSAVSCWEIAVKFELGKLPILPRMAENVEAAASESGLGTLLISFAHCQLAARLPPHHRDPFDRLLLAQAAIEGMTLISNEVLFDRYGVSRVW
jgi:PIN domain nuclease of toxin-antitoxin system